VVRHTEIANAESSWTVPYLFDHHLRIHMLVPTEGYKLSLRVPTPATGE
jgi:hypothetical protein